MKTKKPFYFICFLPLFHLSICQAEITDFQRARIQHEKTLSAGVNSQQKIDHLDDEAQALQAEIKTYQRRIETLEKYNRRMEKLVANQQEELVRLEEETKRVAHLDREMLPLVEEMLHQLDAFINKDIPFLPGERRERLAHLSAMLDRADVTVAEKFRRILEAYQIENEYGRTLEVYTGELKNTERVVDFLRVGRNLLFYKSKNNEVIARWDIKQNDWLLLEKKYHREIKKAYLIAQNQRAPELLLLPMPAAENLQESAQ